MIKAKDISLNNLVIFLVLSLAISVLMFIPKLQVASTKNLPVFMGEEVVVQKAGKVSTAAITEKAITEKAVKATAMPVLPPKIATPLPLIPPSITYKVFPAYPAAALEQGKEGIVILSVFVGLGGQPGKIETKTSSGIAELDNSASAAVAQWKFSPASQGGQAIASWFEVPVRFVIN
jgi:protein TonB